MGATQPVLAKRLSSQTTLAWLSFPILFLGIGWGLDYQAVERQLLERTYPVLPWLSGGFWRFSPVTPGIAVSLWVVVLVDIGNPKSGNCVDDFCKESATKPLSLHLGATLVRAIITRSADFELATWTHPTGFHQLPGLPLAQSSRHIQWTVTPVCSESLQGDIAASSHMLIRANENTVATFQF